MANRSVYFLETGHVVSLLIFAEEHKSFISSDIRHIITNPKTRVELLYHLVDIGFLTDTRDDKRTRTIHYTISDLGKEAVAHIRTVEEIAKRGSVQVDSLSSGDV